MTIVVDIVMLMIQTIIAHPFVTQALYLISQKMAEKRSTCMLMMAKQKDIIAIRLKEYWIHQSSERGQIARSITTNEDENKCSDIIPKKFIRNT